MKPRNTLIAFLLLVAVASYLYLVEIRGAKKREAAKEQEKKLFNLKADDIQSMTLDHAGKTIALSRETSGFRITSPVETAADRYAAKDLADALASLSKESVVVKQPEGKNPYKPFGLDPADTKASLETNGGKKQTVLVGAKNPIGDSYFARLEDDPAVFLIKSGRATALKKDLFSLRNKKLLDFKQDDVKELEIVHGTQKITLKRRKGRWYETAPLSDLARTEKVRGLLGSLEYLEASSFSGRRRQGTLRFWPRYSTADDQAETWDRIGHPDAGRGGQAARRGEDLREAGGRSFRRGRRHRHHGR